jgi:hypothetical protein
MALSAALCSQFHGGCKHRVHDYNQRQGSFLSAQIKYAHCSERRRTGRAQHFPVAAPGCLCRRHASRTGGCAAARVFARGRLASSRRRKSHRPGALHAKYADRVATLSRTSGSSRETQEFVLAFRSRGVATWQAVIRRNRALVSLGLTQAPKRCLSLAPESNCCVGAHGSDAGSHMSA